MGISEANLEKSVSVEQIIKAYANSDDSSEKAIINTLIEILEEKENEHLECWAFDIIPDEKTVIDLCKLKFVLCALRDNFNTFKWVNSLESSENFSGLTLGTVHMKIIICTCEEIICICNKKGKHYNIPLNLIKFNKFKIQNLMQLGGLKPPHDFITKEVEKIKRNRTSRHKTLITKTYISERKKLNREPCNNEVWIKLQSYDDPEDTVIIVYTQEKITFQGSHKQELKPTTRPTFNNLMIKIRKENPIK